MVATSHIWVTYILWLAHTEGPDLKFGHYMQLVRLYWTEKVEDPVSLTSVFKVNASFQSRGYQ